MSASLESQFQSNHHSSNTPSTLDAVTLAWASATPLSSTETNSTPNTSKRKYKHTPEQIAKELKIDEYGRLWWIKPERGRNRHKPISSSDKDGYIRIILRPGNYTGHVLAWVLYYKEWPDVRYDIDHINGIKTDNRKENLRLVTRSQNMLNSHKASKASTSGFPGVSFSNSKNKWRAYIKINYRQIFGGYYDSKEEAILARVKLELEYELGGNSNTK